MYTSLIEFSNPCMQPNVPVCCCSNACGVHWQSVIPIVEVQVLDHLHIQSFFHSCHQLKLSYAVISKCCWVLGDSSVHRLEEGCHQLLQCQQTQTAAWLKHCKPAPFRLHANTSILVYISMTSFTRGCSRQNMGELHDEPRHELRHFFIENTLSV